MRVIAGKYRGITLMDFDGYDIRPTADRTKESLFNILQFKISGKSFLDLFCGTGGVGIEALSRGASRVVFTDESKKSVEITKKNLLKVKENAPVFLTDANSFLSRVTEKFDYIFIDPPYKSEVGERALEIIFERDLLTENGLVIFEKDMPLTVLPKNAKISDTRKYGKAYLTFISKE